jgi:hypothetical protein
MKVSIREWLDKAGFNWETGKIILHKTEGDSPGWEDAKGADYIGYDDPILDQKFTNGYGGPKCPRFIAKDDEVIYFPGMYDGSTWLEGVYVDLDKYLDYKNYPTPYVGGN